MSRSHWPGWHERARLALARRAELQPALTPVEVAGVVAQVLPRSLARRLMAALGEAGWLSPEVRIPFDVFDSSACPLALRGPLRPLAELAVFGLPGQGRPDYKHRDAAYQQICAQIMREAADLPTLSGAAARALSHPDVCRDPMLAGMVRAFISEREAALHTKLRVEHPEPEDTSQLRHPFEDGHAAEFPTRTQLVGAFLRYQHDFETHLAQYNEAAARYALDQMLDLARRFPVHVDRAAAQRHADEFAAFLQRCDMFRRQIEDVARQAAEAASGGDQKTATWLLRRLRAIHALTPVLLPAERFEQLRAGIERCGQQHEHQEALRELIAREREVAEELKVAGAAIYRFEKLARTLSPTSPEYQRAEAAYRAAVERVRQRDTEWLTGLLLELETYLEDLEDPSGKAQEQLERFVHTVRDALNRLRLIIRQIQSDRAAPAPRPHPVPPPAADSAGAPPA